MSEMTNFLSWVHWTLAIAQKIALVGSALFAGALLYRAGYVDPLQRGAELGPALRSFREEAEPADGKLASLAWLGAVAAALAFLGGAGMAWLVGAVAEALAAMYLLTELRRTRHALEIADPGAEIFAGEWLRRWRGQNNWLSLHAAWIPWLLVFQL